MYRKNCIICESPLFENILSLSSFPAYMGVADNNDCNSDIRMNMDWRICGNCGCVQLSDLVDLDILYSRSHNSACGSIWNLHHSEFARFSSNYCNGKTLEIGGGNLYLAKLLKASNYTVCDPNLFENDDPSISIKKGMLEDCDYTDLDCVIHSHVMEHFYEPKLALQKIWSMLKPDGKMIISVPLIDSMIKSGFTNGINFEHTYLLSENILERLLASCGFEICDKEYFSPYNIFLICKKQKDFDFISISEYDKNKILLSEFIKEQKEYVAYANNILSNSDENKYSFGAHIFSQFLFSLGLSCNLDGILDNDKNKIGSRLYGTPLQVFSPSILKNKESIVLLRVAQYEDEIKNSIYKYNKNVRFICKEGD